MAGAWFPVRRRPPRGDAVHVGGHTVEHLGVESHHRPHPPGALHQCEHQSLRPVSWRTGRPPPHPDADADSWLPRRSAPARPSLVVIFLVFLQADSPGAARMHPAGSGAARSERGEDRAPAGQGRLEDAQKVLTS